MLDAKIAISTLAAALGHIEVDRLRAEAVFRAIDDVLQAARVEQAGLTARVDEVLARAAITLGNDTDEFLTRESEDSRSQDTLDAEIAKGQRRLRGRQ